MFLMGCIVFMNISEQIIDIIDMLWVSDCEIKKENIERELRKWIYNLNSHIGEDTHKNSLRYGVEDCTGLSWEEQDNIMLNNIEFYKECLEKLEDMTEDEIDELKNSINKMEMDL